MLTILGGGISQWRAAKTLVDYQIPFQSVDPRKNAPVHQLSNHQIFSDVKDFLRAQSATNFSKILTVGSDYCAKMLSQAFLRPDKFRQLQTLFEKDRLRKAQSELNLIAPNNLSLKICPTFQTVMRLLGDKPYICKPLGSSGSRGVSLITSPETLVNAFNTALKYSKGGILIEQFLPTIHPQLCGDGWIHNGEVVFLGHGNNWPLGKTYTPIIEIFPSCFNDDQLTLLIRDIELLADYAGYKSGPFNIDAILTNDGWFIIELAPRLGGNSLFQAIEYSFGLNLFQSTLPCADIPSQRGESKTCSPTPHPPLGGPKKILNSLRYSSRHTDKSKRPNSALHNDRNLTLLESWQTGDIDQNPEIVNAVQTHGVNVFQIEKINYYDSKVMQSYVDLGATKNAVEFFHRFPHASDPQR